MKRYVLDTSALLTLRDGEPGADQVAALLYEAQNSQTECLACFMTLMELFYRVWKDEGEKRGRLAYEQVQALPLTWVEADRPLLEKAAELKATYLISVADAWIAAVAILHRAELVHKDPELTRVVCPQQQLPANL